jgi:hypothetical protein
VESRIATRLVIGLFHSSGIAEDAVHRLITEGVAPQDIAHRVLKEVGPIPPTLQPELAALEVDPLVIGNARETFARSSTMARRQYSSALSVTSRSSSPATS